MIKTFCDVCNSEIESLGKEECGIFTYYEMGFSNIVSPQSSLLKKDKLICKRCTAFVLNHIDQLANKSAEEKKEKISQRLEHKATSSKV